MKILVLDSSGLVASVAVLENDTVTAEFTIHYKKTHSQTLLPMLEEVKKMVDLDLNTIDAIGITAGPGSFTGLRIGSATAKGLGFALDKPIIPIPTVDGIAYNLYGSDKVICPILDARRNQVYTGIYEFEKKTEEDGCFYYEMIVVEKQKVVLIEELAEELNLLGKEVIFLGDAVPVYMEQIKKLMKISYSFAPWHMNRQRAASIGALAMGYYEKGMIQTADEFEPYYLRLSQAERERIEKEEQSQ